MHRHLKELPAHWAYFYFVSRLLRQPTAALNIKNGMSLYEQEACHADQEKTFDRQVQVVHLVGDSHILSAAWKITSVPETVRSSGQRGRCDRKPFSFQSSSKMVFVPHLVTGLKAWHLQRRQGYLTSAQLQDVVSRLAVQVHAESKRSGLRPTIVLSAGEIDCREGISKAVEKGG